MPLYEYLCESCGRRTEVLQSLGEAPLTTCPECGGALRKLLSAPAFQFKGSGWYVTDYARGGAQKAAAGAPVAAGSATQGDGAAQPEGGGSKADGDGSKTPPTPSAPPSTSSSS